MSLTQSSQFPAPARNKGGRPRWQPDDLAKVERLASQGLTFEQIAASLGIHVATLYKYKRRLNEFNEALEKGRAAGHDTVTSKLFELVRAGNVAAIIFFLKARAGWRDHGPIVEINNQPQHNTNVKIDLDVLMGRVNLLRDAIKVLRDLGIPIAQELELPEVDFKALPAPADREDLE